MPMVAPRFDLSTSGDLAADRRYAWGMAALKDGTPAEAAELLEQALELAPGWPPAWLALGDARLALGLPEAAALAWRRALERDPEDRLGAGPRLAQVGMREAAGALSPAYVAALFDEYAPRFESHLVGALDYCGPALVMEALARVAPDPPFSQVLDAGCGTGLMGAALRPHALAMAGCDLSPAMVARARGKRLYDRVDVAGLEDWLAAEPAGRADLVTAADVLVYLGDLRPVFAGAARALRPGGHLAFTVQTFAAPGRGGFGVGDDLRYRHSEDYLRETTAAAGLTLRLLEPAVVRRDRGEDLPGFVGVARRG